MISRIEDYTSEEISWLKRRIRPNIIFLIVSIFLFCTILLCKSCFDELFDIIIIFSGILILVPVFKIRLIRKCLKDGKKIIDSGLLTDKVIKHGFNNTTY